MIAKAKAKYIRIAPRKVRQVIDLIRGKDINSSLMILAQTKKGPTPFVIKLLNSAVSNAKKKGVTEEQLIVSRIIADQGPSLKRFKAAAFGQAKSILRRTTHLTVELDVKTK